MTFIRHIAGRGASNATAAFVSDMLISCLARVSDPVEREIIESVISEHYENPDLLLDSRYSDPSFILTHFPNASVELFRELYQVGSLLSKWTPPSKDEEAARFEAALLKLEETEQQCDEANARLFELEYRPIDESIRRVLLSAKAKIRRCLGAPNYAELLNSCSFGPGASVSLPRKRGDALFKFGLDRPTATHSLVADGFAYGLLKTEFPSWAQHVKTIDLTLGNQVTTVPKNRKTDRIIAIEPEINSFLQRGIGKMIRRRLTRVGVNLNNQDLNQILAFSGSLDGRLATIDLSSASDTISKELVDYLLPERWADLMNSIRSPVGVLRRNPLSRERTWFWKKHSSMGNGYTFELESLIFWALAEAVIDESSVSERRLGIYGDDIVLSVGAVPLLKSVFAYVGFTINERKSFDSGPFRESCGKHYFRGVDVTPIFVRKDLKDPVTAYSMHNQVVLRGLITYDMEWRCPEMTRVADGIRERTPVKWRVLVPTTHQGGFWATFDEAAPAVRRWRKKHGYDTWYTFDHVVPVGTPLDESGPAVVTKTLHAMEMRGEPEVNTARWGTLDREAGVRYLRRKTKVLLWSDLPPVFKDGQETASFELPIAWVIQNAERWTVAQELDFWEDKS